MCVVGFDTTILSMLLNPRSKPPDDPTTGRRIERGHERVALLVEQLAKIRHKILLPTPVIAELMAAIGPSAEQYVTIVRRSRVFEIASFDEKAAIELAFLNRDVFAAQDGAREEAYQKVKFDRQIVAVLKSRNATTIYTDDRNLSKRAQLCGMTATALHQLAPPAADTQLSLDLEPDTDLPQVDED